MCGDNKELGALAAAGAASPGHSAEAEPVPVSALRASVPSAELERVILQERKDHAERYAEAMNEANHWDARAAELQRRVDGFHDLIRAALVGEVRFLRSGDASDVEYLLADSLERVAQAIEARRAETGTVSAVDESAVPAGNAPQSPRQNISDVLIEALEEFCRAAEYWAGCDEGCDPDTASSEIMRSGGSWPACAYDKARDALRQAKGGSDAS